MANTPNTPDSADTRKANGPVSSPVSSPQSSPLSSPLVAALEATWAAIQHRHPDLPDVVVVVASGSVGAPRGALKLGHFAAMRWTTTDPGDAANRSTLPEVFVGGEGLARGAVDVLGTLLHEATHALAHVRGVKDTSRQGRYHNRRFRDLAAETGLEVREVPVIGWSDTHIPQATTAEYAAELDALRQAMTIHRRAEGLTLTPADPGKDGEDGDDPDTTGTDTGAAANPRNGVAARCACGRRIRVTASVLALGPITCGLCGKPFATATPDEEVDEAGTAAEGIDVAGSASRQHHIDTGHYLDTDGGCRCDEEVSA